MDDTIGLAWLAPFLWGLAGLVAVRLLGRERLPGGTEDHEPRRAEEPRRAA